MNNKTRALWLCCLTYGLAACGGSDESTNASTLASAGTTRVPFAASKASTALDLSAGPLFEIGNASADLPPLLAAEGDKVVYFSERESAAYRSMDTANQSEATLNVASDLTIGWQLGNGNVYARGRGDDCPEMQGMCIYQFTPTGQRINLSTGNPYPATQGFITQFTPPKVQGNHVAWAMQDALFVYDAIDKKYMPVRKPAAVSSIDPFEYGFYVDGNNVTVYYQTKVESGKEAVYKWTSATNTSTRLALGAAPRTDGQRVVWKETTTENKEELFSQPVAGGAITKLSANIWFTSPMSLEMRDGVVVWREWRDGVMHLMAATTSNEISEISTHPHANLYGMGSGYVVYDEGEKIYSWNSKTKKSSLLLDLQGKPELQLADGSVQVVVTGDIVYFGLGKEQKVYKLRLH